MKIYTNYKIPRRVAYLEIGLLPTAIFFVGIIVSLIAKFLLSVIIFFTITAIFFILIVSLIRLDGRITILHLLLNYFFNNKKEIIWRSEGILSDDPKFTMDDMSIPLMKNISFNVRENISCIGKHNGSNKTPSHLTFIFKVFSNGISSSMDIDTQDYIISNYATWLNSLSDNKLIMNAKFITSIRKHIDNNKDKKKNLMETIESDINKISNTIDEYLSITYRYNFRKSLNANIDSILIDLLKHQSVLENANMSLNILDKDEAINCISNIYHGCILSNIEKLKKQEQLIWLLPLVTVETPVSYRLNERLTYNYHLSNAPVSSISSSYIDNILKLNDDVLERRITLSYRPILKRASSGIVERDRKKSSTEAYGGNRIKMKSLKNVEDSDKIALDAVEGDNLIDCSIFVTDVVDRMSHSNYYHDLPSEFSLMKRMQSIGFHINTPFGFIPEDYYPIPLLLEEFI